MRTRFTAVVVGVGLVAVACSSSSVPPHRPAHAPNVLFILADDLDLAATAAKYMPHVQSLIAQQGMTLDNYFISNSLCCPSRTTIVRGQYAHNTGVEANAGPHGGFPAAYRSKVVDDTVGTWMQKGGYATALYGKFLNGYPNTAGASYVPTGWSDWGGAIDSPQAYGEYNYDVVRNGTKTHFGTGDANYGTNVYTGFADDFVRAQSNANKPFFAYLALFAPHQPAMPAQQDLTKFAPERAPRSPSYDEADVSDKPAWVRAVPRLSPSLAADVDALYRRCIRSLQAVDRGVAKLIDTLQSTGELANTYVVFTSDNGFHLGEHRLPAGKRTPYESDIHVPFYVRGPGIAAGSHASVIAGNVDLAATFAAIGSAKPSLALDGRSLLDIWHGHSATSWRSGYLLEHWPEPQRIQQTSDHDLSVSIKSALGKAEPSHIPHYVGVRTLRYTYVEYETGERELYDLQSDPDELDNLAPATTPSVLDGWHRYLTPMTTCRGAGCLTADTATPPQ